MTVRKHEVKLQINETLYFIPCFPSSQNKVGILRRHCIFRVSLFSSQADYVFKRNYKEQTAAAVHLKNELLIMTSNIYEYVRHVHRGVSSAESSYLSDLLILFIYHKLY